MQETLGVSWCKLDVSIEGEKSFCVDQGCNDYFLFDFEAAHKQGNELIHLDVAVYHFTFEVTHYKD